MIIIRIDLVFDIQNFKLNSFKIQEISTRFNIFMEIFTIAYLRLETFEK